MDMVRMAKRYRCSGITLRGNSATGVMMNMINMIAVINKGSESIGIADTAAMLKIWQQRMRCIGGPHPLTIAEAGALIDRLSVMCLVRAMLMLYDAERSVFRTFQ